MRLKVLAAKEASIQEILHEAKAKLKDVPKSTSSYKALLQSLIVQVRHATAGAATGGRAAQ